MTLNLTEQQLELGLQQVIRLGLLPAGTALVDALKGPSFAVVRLNAWMLARGLQQPSLMPVRRREPVIAPEPPCHSLFDLPLRPVERGGKCAAAGDRD